VPKIAFGFDENPNARGFDDLFPHSTIALHSRTNLKGLIQICSLMIQHTVFYRARIAKNVGGPYLVDDQGLAIQEVVSTLFAGAAYVVDKKA